MVGLDREYIEAMELYVYPVATDSSVETLRTIRNACAGGFSYDTGEISKEQQGKWWRANRNSVIARLYYRGVGFGRRVVGYGLLRNEKGIWYSSVAVLPEEAGRGYGGFITGHIIRMSPSQEVSASARIDNPAACALHRRRDWEEVERDDRLIYYRTRPQVYTTQPIEIEMFGAR